ncbi:hypothetical protein K439DRAFT_1348946, partial [Ramaria rubella]
YGLVTQARMGHAFTGEYYETNVPSNDIGCPCGTAKQTREHILRDCPRYDAYRHILQMAVPSGHIPDILGTKEGITALAEFIEASGAFTKTGEPPKPLEEEDNRAAPEDPNAAE